MAVLSEAEILISHRVIECFKYFEYDKIKGGKTIFAEEFGIDKSNLSKYLSINRPFPVDFLVNLTKIKNINGHWLLTGEGKMFNNFVDQNLVVNNTPVTYTFSDEEFRNAENEGGILHLVARKMIKSLPIDKYIMMKVLKEDIDKEIISRYLNPKAKAFQKQDATVGITNHVLVRERKTGKLFIYKDSPEITLYEENGNQELQCIPMDENGQPMFKEPTVTLNRKDCEYTSWGVFYDALKL